MEEISAICLPVHCCHYFPTPSEPLSRTAPNNELLTQQFLILFSCLACCCKADSKTLLDKYITLFTFANYNSPFQTAICKANQLSEQSNISTW